MHPVKRRKLDAINSTLTKPFRSPLRPSTNTTSHQSDVVNRPAPEQKEAAAPSTATRQTQRAPVITDRDAQSTLSPVVTSEPSHEALGDVDALQKQYSSLARKLTSLRQSLDIVQQADKLESSDQSSDLNVLTAKWKSVVRDTADELFEDAKDRVEKQGGIQNWLKRQEKEGPDSWSEEQHNKLTDAQRKMLEVQREDERAEADRYGLIEKEPPEANNTPTFTMDAMLQQMGIDLDLVGYSKEEQRNIIHCAAPLNNDPGATEFNEHFEKPNVIGNTGLLTFAHEYGPNVKAIAVTGSINAVTNGEQEDVKARAFTSDKWLPYTREGAIRLINNFLHYCVGKKLGEEAIWKFMKESPKFHVSVFLPALIFGPMQQNVTDIGKANFLMSQVYAIMNSGKNETGMVPDTMFPAYGSRRCRRQTNRNSSPTLRFDLRDLAHLHIDSLTNPKAANKRFLTGFPFKFDMFADLLRKDPEYKDKVGKDNNEDITLPRIDMAPVEEAFGIKWLAMEQTVGDCARDLVRVESMGS